MRDEIQRIADTLDMTVSYTQDAPVFHAPPRVQEPPKKGEAADLYPALAAQVLHFIGEFDGSRLGYGDIDAQAAETIAEQLAPAWREEIRRLLALLRPCRPGGRNRGRHHLLHGGNRGAASGDSPGAGLANPFT